MHSVLIRYLLASTLLTITASLTAEEDRQLGTMTVTATRVEEKNTDIAASIGSKDQKEIELDSPATQKELLNSIAGVYITQTSSTIGHMTGIRMPVNTGPYYLLLQDGVPVQSSGFFNHNGLAYTNFSSAGSAEVLKGAGTALYGSDAVAATINIISMDIPVEKELSISAEAGSDGFYRLGVSGGGQINDTVGMAASASHAESDGWRDHTAYERNEISFKHDNNLNETNSLKTTFSANRSRAEMAGSLIGRDEFENNTTSVGNVSSALDSGIAIERKFDFARLGTEWVNETYEATQISTIAYVRSNRNRYIATWERNLPQNDSQEKTIGLLLKADMDRNKFRFISGIDAEYTQANREYNQLFDYVPASFGSSVAEGKIYDYDVDYFAIAPYLRTEYQLSDKLQLAGGLRYDSNSYQYTNNVEDGQYAESSYSRASDDNDPSFNHFSPKLDVSYSPNDNQLLYARYANGFRIPQASRLYSLRTNNIDFNLDPETTDTFEIGFKLATEAHEFDAAIYHMNIDDTIVRRENTEGDRYYVNGGKTSHQGVELSLASNLSDELTTKLAYSYSQHEYDNDEVFGSNEQASAPKDIANLRLIYAPEKLKGLTAMIEWQHVGSWWMDDNNTQKYEGYDIGNIKLSYQPVEQLRLFAKVNNFTDELYAEAATISYGSERFTPGSPRQLFAGVEYTW